LAFIFIKFKNIIIALSDFKLLKNDNGQ